MIQLGLKLFAECHMKDVLIEHAINNSIRTESSQSL